MKKNLPDAFRYPLISHLIIVISLIFTQTACSAQSINTSGNKLATSRPLIPANEQNSNERFEPNEEKISLDAQIHFKNYSVNDGLLTNTVNDIIQDHTGYLWIATDDGLNRFDGYEFKALGLLSTISDSVSSSPIIDLFIDRTGHIWISSLDEGLIEYAPENGGFTIYESDPENPNSISSNRVISIFQDNQGIYWFGTNNGLNRFNKDENEWLLFSNRSPEHSKLISNSITTIIQNSDGDFWIGTKGGLCFLTQTTFETTCYKHNPRNVFTLSSNNITSILEDQFGQIWIGSQNGGLDKFSPDRDLFFRQFTNLKLKASNNRLNVTTLIEDPSGIFWVGTDQGLVLYNPINNKHKLFTNQSTNETSIGSNQINALVTDKAGGVWIATATGGISYYDPLSNNFPHFIPFPPSSFETSRNSIQSIWEGESGYLWLGTAGSGLIGISNQSQVITQFTHNPADINSISGNVINSIFEDSQGTVWVGTEGDGLNKFTPPFNYFFRYRTDPDNPNSISSDTVNVIFEDHAGTIWLGTDNGLCNYNRDTNQFIRYVHDPADPNSISNDIVTAIQHDKDRTLWIGTYNGLNNLNLETGKFTRYPSYPNQPNGLSHPIVTSILQDRRGFIWVGTNGGGLNKLDIESETILTYRITDGLISDSIIGILEDASGNLWISTMNGVSKFNPTKVTFKNYDQSDGLQSNQFNFGSYFKNKNGEIFLGGNNGYNRFYPYQIKANKTPPVVLIQQIAQNSAIVPSEVPFETLQDITLEWPNNFFDFEAIALNFHETEQNRYAFKLEGFDEEWNFNDTRRYGRYTNLPGGTYTLRVIASNSDGIWNTQGASIEIIITPPTWQSWWFLSLLGISFLILVITLFRIQVRSLEKQRKALEMQVTERTEEINQRRRQIESLYRADEDLYRLVELEELLQVLVDKAVEILGADKGSLLCFDDTGENIVIRAAHGFNKDTVSLVEIPKDQGVVGWVTRSGEIASVEDTNRDQRVTLQLVEAERIGAFLQAPIKVGNEVFGALSVDYLKPRTFSDEDKRILASFAQRAGLAIENVQLYNKARELAASQERNRIARELHDAVTQTLFSASLIAEALPSLWERDPEKGKERLDKLRQMSRGALAEMRSMLLELRPAALITTDLPSLLKQLGEAVTGREGVAVEVNIQGDLHLPNDVHIALYRIAQEALNNIIKHAKATNVELSLRSIQPTNEDISKVVLKIIDDGRGFNIDEEFPNRFGLGIMQERATSIHAELQISSTQGEGTSIEVTWQQSNNQKTGNYDE